MSLFDDFDENKQSGGTSEIEGGEKSRVRMSDKRTINGVGDVNQLVPIKYKWAWQAYLDGTSNRWMPAEVELTYDKVTWQSGALHAKDKQAIYDYVESLHCLEPLSSKNYIVGAYRHVTAPECRQYYLCQQFERAIHGQCAGHTEQQLGFTPEEVYDFNADHPARDARKAFTQVYVELLNDPDFNTAAFEDTQRFLEAFIVMFCINDAVFSARAFDGLYSVTKQHNLPGLREQMAKIVKDRHQHLDIAYHLVSMLIAENPDVWTGNYRQRIENLFQEALSIELKMANTDHHQALEFVVNEQLRRLGLPFNRNLTAPVWWSMKKEEHHSEPKQQASASLEW